MNAMDSSELEKKCIPKLESEVPESRYWKCYVIGPEDIERPIPGELKGYYYFKKWGNIDFDDLWSIIEKCTRNGELGYYAGISDDKKVMAVHFADCQSEEQTERIEDKLRELGIVGISELNKKRAENAVYLKPSQQLEATEDDSSYQDFVYI